MSGELRACRRAGAGGVVGLALIMNVAGAAAADVVSDEVPASRVDELNRFAVHQVQAKRFDAGRKHLFEAARLARERGACRGMRCWRARIFTWARWRSWRARTRRGRRTTSGGRCAVTPACDCPSRSRRKPMSSGSFIWRRPSTASCASVRRRRSSATRRCPPASMSSIACFPRRSGRDRFHRSLRGKPAASRRRGDAALRLRRDVHLQGDRDAAGARAAGGRPPSRRRT